MFIDPDKIKYICHGQNFKWRMNINGFNQKFEAYNAEPIRVICFDFFCFKLSVSFTTSTVSTFENNNER